MGAIVSSAQREAALDRINALYRHPAVEPLIQRANDGDEEARRKLERLEQRAMELRS